VDHSIPFHKDQSLAENWENFIVGAKKLSPLVGAQLEHAALTQLSGNRMVLSVPENEKYFVDQLKDSKQIAKVKDLVQRLWSLDVMITVETHAETAPVASPQATKVIQEKTSAQQTREQVENHPAIQNIQKTFKGKIHNIKEL